MARIANNIAALNSWRQLTKNESMFSTSLEKLSSGFRINKAGDDPAGLVLSEQFRAQITGLKQAVSNTQDAASMIQTAEGNMQEMHSILNQIRGLVLHAKNTGVNDSISIAADQNQVDEAVNALNKIANNTYFGGKSLLDGSLGNRATVADVTNITAATAGATAPAGTTVIGVATLAGAVAERAILAGDQSFAGAKAGGTITVNGYTVTIGASANIGAGVAAVQVGLDNAGLGTTIEAVANGNNIDIRHRSYGSAYSVSINDAAGYWKTAGFNADTGLNVRGTINGQAATGSGLTLTADAGTTYAGTTVTLTGAAAEAANTTYANSVAITQGQLTFQVGSSASDTVSASITDVRAAALGTTAGGATGLNAILTGATTT
jgi:flagellin